MTKTQVIEANGSVAARVYVPLSILNAFASLLFACIVHSSVPNASKRLGTRTLIDNCRSGIAGQLAVVFFLRQHGLHAYMPAPSQHKDAGWDVSFGTDQLQAHIEVRTSCFKDNRGFERLRLGDRMRLGRLANAPEFFFWCVTQPHFDTREMQTSPYVDIVATLPRQLARNGPKVVSAVPGIRWGSVRDHNVHVVWFLETMAQVRDHDLTLSPCPADSTFSTVMGVLQHRWVRHGVLGFRQEVVPRYPQAIIALAERMFDELRARGGRRVA
jgi:hypothetical protein